MSAYLLVVFLSVSLASSHHPGKRDVYRYEGTHVYGNIDDGEECLKAANRAGKVLQLTLLNRGKRGKVQAYCRKATTLPL